VNKVTKIDLLRHGEVEGGACYRGSQDDALTKKGWQQMQQATENKCWDIILSSPLKRCSNFAKHLSKDAAECLILDDLREIDFGDWEGKTADELFQQQTEHFNRFLRNPDSNPPPNGEALREFHQRIAQQWHNIILQYQMKHILIISHGGTMRSIISQVLKIPNSHFMRLEVPHASITRIKVYHYGNESFPTLVSHGQTP